MSEMRRRDRQVTDLAEIKEIVEKNMILHLGLFDKEFPYVVPLHYGYEYDEGKNQFIFYMHGAKQGHKIDLIIKIQMLVSKLKVKSYQIMTTRFHVSTVLSLPLLSDVEKQNF
ncbi:pyridoxamine 5'-phosphate oxidase family protein [Streptococcus infantarius]|uniref:pyridoxamine 5'-phosphate oxidase family protein n=1 Tax=Streptococcus infantarius TaxID=102684 RepID=UPI002FD86B0A